MVSKQRVSMMTREKKENCNIASLLRISNTPFVAINKIKVKVVSAS